MELNDSVQSPSAHYDYQWYRPRYGRREVLQDLIIQEARSGVFGLATETPEREPAESRGHIQASIGCCIVSCEHRVQEKRMLTVIVWVKLEKERTEVGMTRRNEIRAAAVITFRVPKENSWKREKELANNMRRHQIVLVLVHSG
ncbi:hypothetical protein LSTR_LSTR006207 [Laodelphax striatellus]|uniref:Uncharacterized protein n=1 Tax=Laodelphax striatellus TaxID=195883 RepID=A0A482XRW3_LAOST|nr:hypothetical protein LSTR_LSTR006207 [Laodelphax striatellus]